MLGKLIDKLIKANVRQRVEEGNIKSMGMSNRTKEEIESLIKEIDRGWQEE